MGAVGRQGEAARKDYFVAMSQKVFRCDAPKAGTPLGEHTFSVQLPENVRPGQTLSTMLADGTLVQFVAPLNAAPRATHVLMLPSGVASTTSSLKRLDSAIWEVDEEAKAEIDMELGDDEDLVGKASPPSRKSRILPRSGFKYQ